MNRLFGMAIGRRTQLAIAAVGLILAGGAYLQANVGTVQAVACNHSRCGGPDICEAWPGYHCEPLIGECNSYACAPH